MFKIGDVVLNKDVSDTEAILMVGVIIHINEDGERCLVDWTVQEDCYLGEPGKVYESELTYLNGIKHKPILPADNPNRTFQARCEYARG